MQTDGTGEKPLSHTADPEAAGRQAESMHHLQSIKNEKKTKKKNINPGSLNAVTKGYIIFYGTY